MAHERQPAPARPRPIDGLGLQLPRPLPRNPPMDYPTFLAEVFGQPEDSDPVEDIGNRFGDRLDYLCYMFRDTFVVYPGNAPPRVIDAAIDVMAESLRSDCEACQVSALHGLGHWVAYRPDAKAVVERFLATAPKGMNPVVKRYAEEAGRGCVQ